MRHAPNSPRLDLRPYSVPADRQRSQKSRRGFSLIEVTIALGLVSFVAVSVIGLLPTGLSVMRNAMDQTVEAQIVRSISGQSQVANFTNLTQGGPSYFDHEGQLLSSGEGARYTVTLSRHSPVFPGSSGAPTGLSNSLVSLQIEIVQRRGPQDKGSTNLRTLYIANYGK